MEIFLRVHVALFDSLLRRIQDDSVVHRLYDGTHLVVDDIGLLQKSFLFQLTGDKTCDFFQVDHELFLFFHNDLVLSLIKRSDDKDTFQMIPQVDRICKD